MFLSIQVLPRGKISPAYTHPFAPRRVGLYRETVFLTKSQSPSTLILFCLVSGSTGNFFTVVRLPGEYYSPLPIVLGHHWTVYHLAVSG